jgi:antitoxin (DNA-binding transcriptional repressor) of toxin-antitoxin stability system
MNEATKPTVFSVAEAKAKFYEIIKRAEAGERFVVTRHGNPVVEIAASGTATPKKKLRGAMKDQIRIAPDFDVLGSEWDEYVR